jgi:hypothetical protein
MMNSITSKWVVRTDLAASKRHIFSPRNMTVYIQPQQA